MEDNYIVVSNATEADVSVISLFIRKLAEYEKLSHQVVSDEDSLRENLFGRKRFAEVFIARYRGEPAGFALFFHNFSTFLGRPGLYLEDLFVLPEFRKKGIGKALFKVLAMTAVERKCGRMEWAVLEWNKSAMDFYERMGAGCLDDWRIFRLTGEALTKLGGE